MTALHTHALSGDECPTGSINSIAYEANRNN